LIAAPDTRSRQTNSPPPHTAAGKASVETMLAALAAKNDAQERRIATLERTAAQNETAGKLAGALARAIGGLIGVRLP
jgi:hypothetical protein